MKTIKITGVPEHFNYPWKKLIQSQPYLKQGVHLEWIEESRGSGQMNLALREGETDLAIVLTESFMKEQEAGNPSKMIGFHVKSPLIWGIHIHGDSKVNQLSEIKNPKFLVSRMGSGSHLMAFVLAKREGWKSEELAFNIVDNLPGALNTMKAETPEMFLWEKYTTKPFVDNGEMKRIGEVPSPWPCFVIAASDSILKSDEKLILDLRNRVYAYSKDLIKHSNFNAIIAKEYKLEEEDVKLWFDQTEWATEASISLTEFNKIIHVMLDLGIVKNQLNIFDLSPANSMIIHN